MTTLLCGATAILDRGVYLLGTVYTIPICGFWLRVARADHIWRRGPADRSKAYPP